MTEPKRWFYGVSRVEPVDGDTIDTRIVIQSDIGFRFNATMELDVRFRLQGIDTPERRGATRTLGEMAKRALENLLARGPMEAIEVESTGEAYKYGGVWMARVSVPGVGDVADWMIANGYARAYDGKTARSQWNPDFPYPIRKGGA